MLSSEIRGAAGPLPDGGGEQTGPVPAAPTRLVMQQALTALELLAKYENPQTKIQVRKKDGGLIFTMYPHKVASDAAQAIRAALAEPEQAATCKPSLQVQEPAKFVCSTGLCKFRRPLTDEEIWKCLPPDPDELAFARAIERAHGIGGGE